MRKSSARSDQSKNKLLSLIKERNQSANLFAAQFKKELRKKVSKERATIRRMQPAIPRVKNQDMNRAFRAIDRLIIHYAKGTQNHDWKIAEKSLKGLITMSNSLNKKVAKAAKMALTDFVLPDLDILVRTNASDAMLMLLLLKEESLDLKFRLQCEEREDRWLSTIVTANENRRTTVME